jgi:hypothetical protein
VRDTYNKNEQSKHTFIYIYIKPSRTKNVKSPPKNVGPAADPSTAAVAVEAAAAAGAAVSVLAPLIPYARLEQASAAAPVPLPPPLLLRSRSHVPDRVGQLVS